MADQEELEEECELVPNSPRVVLLLPPELVLLVALLLVLLPPDFGVALKPLLARVLAWWNCCSIWLPRCAMNPGSAGV